METFPTIPLTHWKVYGTWRDTLEKDLKMVLLRAVPRSMVLSSEKAYDVPALKRILGITFPTHIHEQGSLEDIPGFNYYWGSSDGRGTDILRIYGPYDLSNLIWVIGKLEDAGIAMVNRCSLLIEFYDGVYRHSPGYGGSIIHEGEPT